MYRRSAASIQEQGSVSVILAAEHTGLLSLSVTSVCQCPQCPGCVATAVPCRLPAAELTASSPPGHPANFANSPLNIPPFEKKFCNCRITAGPFFCTSSLIYQSYAGCQGISCRHTLLHKSTHRAQWVHCADLRVRR